MPNKVAPSGRRRIVILSITAFVFTILIASLAGHERLVHSHSPFPKPFYQNLYPLGWAKTVDEARTDRTGIVMIDTRSPSMPQDPEEEISFWTISILHNYLYAKTLGIPFMLYNLDPLMEDDGVTAQLDDTEGEVRLPAYCKHPDFGFRMVAFCKLLVVWNIWQQNSQIGNLVVIDSDAVFKSPKNHIQSHLDYLSRRRPVGFLRDLLYDEEGPCAGYWFASRGVAALPRSGDSLGNETGVEFLEDWWNMNWAETDYRYDREQGLLKKMVRDRQGSNQVNAVVRKVDLGPVAEAVEEASHRRKASS